MNSSIEEVISCSMESQQGQSAMHNTAGDGHTQLASPLSDSNGNEISAEDLKKMLGSGSELTIGVLQNMSPIGMGGIGAVFSAQDPVLRREIAIKILRPAYRNQLEYVSSFIREARITAQIDHPNVIPVHKLGMFDDAGAYFTMKRVKGITLAQILRKLREGDPEAIKTYTRQRLLEIFVAICNGAAFAHSKGIIHRDLKPANIMVGEYGEVFIADWGLAIYREEDDRSNAARKISLGHLPEEKKPVGETTRVSGTPAFMAPEQIVSKDDELDSQIDVYALGTILYSILTWEPSPFEGASTVTELMQNVASHKFLRPRRRAPRRKIPYELEAITLKAMHNDKKRRYESVKALLSDVRNYLAKYPVSAYSPLPHYRLYKLIRRRPLVPVTLLAALLTLGAWNLTMKMHNYIESRSVLIMANELLNECEKSRNQAISSRSKLNESFAKTGNTEIHGSNLRLKSRYLISRNEFTVTCNNAWDMLTKLLGLNVDHQLLAKYIGRLLNNQVQFANAVGNRALLKQAVDRVNSLPDNIRKQLFENSPALARQAKMAELNSGELKLNISQKGITVIAVKDAETVSETPVGNDLENTFIKIQPAPAINILKSGQYMLFADLPDKRKIRFPVSIEQDKLEVLDFDPPPSIPENMVYIPEGNFIFGERAFDDQFARTRLDAFMIGKYEVTIGEYLEFWQSLKNPVLKEQYRARIDDNILLGRKLRDLWDDSGKIIDSYSKDMPVIGVAPEAALAYMKYMSQKTNMHYRLPTALEWEKAARGVDGREYVWGNDFKQDNACISGQENIKKRPAKVGSYPADCSIYGVFDLTGNVRELVTNPGSWQYYTAKGSSFRYSRRFARVASQAYGSNLSDVGFRCVIDLSENKK